MPATSIYPVLMTTDVPTTATFYREAFGFTPVFESDWYVSLSLDRWELAILDATHETVPQPFRGRTAAGVLLNIEVDDVDAVHARLAATGSHEIVLPPRSEDFGQRHFIIAGPDDVLIDVITPIEPTAEFAASFA